MQRKIPIGSIKSNIGHLESAAGLAGLVKVLLQFRYQCLAPSINALEDNPHIHWDQTPFYLNKELKEWHETPKIASISSFGAGGANAHMILQEHHTYSSSVLHKKTEYFTIPLSAKTTSSFLKSILQLTKILSTQPNIDIYALGYTLACTRTHEKYRISFIVSSLKELYDQLCDYLKQYPRYSQKNSAYPFEEKSHEALAQNKSWTASYTIAKQYQAGYDDIAWSSLYAHRQVLPLAIDMFDEFFHWIDTPKYGLCLEERYLHHHIIQGKSLLPATYPLVKICNTLKNTVVFKNLLWKNPLMTLENHQITYDNNQITFSDHKGTICLQSTLSKTSYNPPSLNLSTLLSNQSFKHTANKQSIYQTFSKIGYKYGSMYQKLEHAQWNHNSALGIIFNTHQTSDILDISIMDALLQTAILPTALSDHDKEKIFIPFHVDSFVFLQPLKTDICFSYVEVMHTSEDNILMHCSLLDEHHQTIVYFDQLTSKSVHIKSIIEPEVPNKEQSALKTYKF